MTTTLPAHTIIKFEGILLRKERRGINEFHEAVILGSNANLSSLTEAQRRRTEAVLARVAQRAALVSRKMPRGLINGEPATQSSHLTR